MREVRKSISAILLVLISAILLVVLGLFSYRQFFVEKLQSVQKSSPEKEEIITSSVGEITVVLLSDDLNDKENNFKKTKDALEIVLLNQQIRDYIRSFMDNGWTVGLSCYNAKHFYDAYADEGSPRRYGSTHSLDILLEKTYKSVIYKYSTYVASLHLGVDGSRTYDVHLGQSVSKIEKAVEVVNQEFHKTILDKSRDKTVVISDNPNRLQATFFYNNDKEFEWILFSSKFDILYHSREKVLRLD
jgi:hypothetical protein